MVDISSDVNKDLIIDSTSVVGGCDCLTLHIPREDGLDVLTSEVVLFAEVGRVNPKMNAPLAVGNFYLDLIPAFLQDLTS